MNDTFQETNMFTIKADVIFHAASPDSPDSSITSEEKDNVVPKEVTASPSEMGLRQDHQTLCEQRSWDVTPSDHVMDNPLLVHHSLATRDFLQDGGSSDSGFQDHIQPLDLTKGELFDPSHGHQPESLDANGINKHTNGARAKAPCSTGPSLCFRGDTKEEMDKASSVSDQGNVVRKQCEIPNVPTLPQDHTTTDSYSVSRETRPFELALCHLTGASTGADPDKYRTPYEHSELDTSQEEKHNDTGGALAMKEEPDLVIEVGGQRIQAHKSVLAAKSDYFKARLSRDILKVKGMSYKTLSILIEYVYSSQMNVNKSNVVDVITGAKILQMPCAVQAAIDSMSKQVTAGNCYEILTIAKKQRLNELKETAYSFMSDNFLQVLKDPAVYGRLTGSERDLILRNRMEGKKCLMVSEINDVFDRVGSRPPSRSNSRPQSPLSASSFEENHMIYYYHETTKDWRALTVMPEDINTKGCGICTMHNYLFVAGGIRGYGEKGKVSDKVFCYNPITDSWSETRPMNQARSQLKLVSMDGYLYAIGGECLFTVEKYDPRMDRWTSVAPLPKGAFAVAHEATTCNGEVYVSGGSLFYRLLKYDPKRDEWQECPYNNSRKKSSDMVALKSFIYRFDVNREQGVNVFKYNTIVKMWHDCASKDQDNPLPFRCAVIGNCIYCVNKTQTLQFVVEEEGARFVENPLKPPLEAKGILFPFILSLPEKNDKNM